MSFQLGLILKLDIRNVQLNFYSGFLQASSLAFFRFCICNKSHEVVAHSYTNKVHLSQGDTQLTFNL